MFGRNRKQKSRAALSSDVFPPVDFDALRKSLRLEARGLENGRAGYPDSSASEPDTVEREIVAAVESLRRQGLREAAEHERVYRERIAAGHSGGPEIRQVVNETETDFRRDVDIGRGQLNDARADLHRSEADLEQFKQDNNLSRSAHESGGWLKWVAICMVVVLVESVFNGVLFARTNTAGLLGGTIVALGISVVNVGMASVAGHSYRFKNHIRFWLKVTGWIFMLSLTAFAILFNFFIGHLRDSMSELPLEKAAGAAVENVISGNPLMQSLDAWLLTGLGLLIAAIAGWKAYDARDPYPGYSRVSEHFIRKRESWRDLREDTFGSLIETRDKAAADLKDEYDKVRERFDTARSARQGFLDLLGRRRDFLRECDRAAGNLLAVYRDANRRARNIPEPDCFRRPFQFDPVEEPAEPERLDSEEDMRRAAELVEQAVERVHEVCQSAMDAFGDDRANSR